MFSQLLKRIRGNKITFRVMSSILAVIFLMVTGCGNHTGTGSKNPGVNSDSSSKVENISDSSSKAENLFDDTSDTSNDINSVSTHKKTNSILSYEVSVKEARADAKEVRPKGNCASLSNPLTGYADKQADELRKDILNTKNTDNYYKITGTKYYISTDGDDIKNDGKSEKSPFRTVNALDNIKLKSGDAVLFERGSIFRLTHSIKVVDGVTYGSYGEGDKPCIYASPKNYAASGTWTATQKKNVWKTDYYYDEVGALVFDHGKDIGYYESSGLNKLTKNGLFYHNQGDGIFYLYCDKGNPSNVYEDIEIMPTTNIIDFDPDISNVNIDNLCLKYSALFGVSVNVRCNNVSITNCEIGYIGGSTNGGTVRLGNAIQAWASNKNLIFNHNWIYQTFDTAITWQGMYGGKYQDIHFDNNLLEYNNADFEFFDYEGAEVKNFSMNNNIMRFTCLGWGTRLDDAGIRGIEGCIKGETTKFAVFENVSFKNNIMDCPGKEVINWTLTEEQYSQLSVSNNKLYVKSSYREHFKPNDWIIKGLKLTGKPTGSALKATNQAELEYAYKMFDTSATSVIEWH